MKRYFDNSDEGFCNGLNWFKELMKESDISEMELWEGVRAFRVMALQEFTKRPDIPLADTTKWLKQQNYEPNDISD